MDTETRPMTAVQCPECGETINVPIDCRINASLTEAAIECTPDLTDVWAHAWTHEVELP